MPDKTRQYQGRHRGRRRGARRPLGQTGAPGTAPSASATPPRAPAVQPRPFSQPPPAAKASGKLSLEQALKVTPVKELKRIGIIAGSMFLILFILAFILK